MPRADMTGADTHPTDADTRHTVVATSVSHLVGACRDEARAASVFAELGLSPSRRFDFDRRLPEDGVLAGLERLDDDLDLGLRAATSPSGHFSPMWHFASAAEVVADLFDVARTYFWLTWTRLRPQVVVGPDDASIVYPPTPDRAGAHMLLRYLVAEQLWSTQHAFAAEPVPLRSLALPGPPGDGEAWRRVVGVVPRFGADQARVVASRASLDVPCRKPDPALADWLRYLLDHRVSDVRQPVSTTQEVSEQVRRRLARPPNRATVAASLGITGRTLARRLAAEDTTFQDVVDRVRFEAATAWLPDHSVAEVSERLGFSDVRSFQRAFKRWSGTSPRGWRS